MTQEWGLKRAQSMESSSLRHMINFRMLLQTCNINISKADFGHWCFGNDARDFVLHNCVEKVWHIRNAIPMRHDLTRGRSLRGFLVYPRTNARQELIKFAGAIRIDKFVRCDYTSLPFSRIELVIPNGPAPLDSRGGTKAWKQPDFAHMCRVRQLLKNLTHKPPVSNLKTTRAPCLCPHRSFGWVLVLLIEWSPSEEHWQSLSTTDWHCLRFWKWVQYMARDVTMSSVATLAVMRLLVMRPLFAKKTLADLV